MGWGWTAWWWSWTPDRGPWGLFIPLVATHPSSPTTPLAPKQPSSPPHHHLPFEAGRVRCQKQLSFWQHGGDGACLRAVSTSSLSAAACRCRAFSFASCFASPDLCSRAGKRSPLSRDDCEPTLLSSQAAAAWMRKGKLRGRDPPIGKVQVVGIFLKRPISAPWENGLVGCRALVRRLRPGPCPPERCTQPRAVEAFWTVP